MKIKHLNIIVFCVVLALLGGMSVINISLDSPNNNKNRITTELADFTAETIVDGSFIRSVENMFSDRFIFRNQLISVAKGVETFKSFGSSDIDIVEYAGANVTEAMGQDGVKETKWGKILIYDGAAMEINTFDEPSARAYANSINRYADVFPALKIHSMLVPTQIEWIDNEDYQELTISQEETIATTNSFFDETIHTIDVYENMKLHQDEYLYYRTDHHWTQRGAYYAFESFAKELNLPIPSLSEYKTTLATGYLGSLYNVTLSEAIAKNPDDIEVFYPLEEHTYTGIVDPIKYNEGNVIVDKWLNEKEKYACFLGGDQPLVKIETELTNGKRILVLKDSYANALVPFFADIAEIVIVIDPRMYDGDVSKIIDDYDITDILFVNYALITRWDGYSSLYNELLPE